MNGNIARRDVRLVDAAPGALRTGTVSRRGVLKVAFWTGIGAALAGAGATIINLLYPRGISGFGGPVPVPADAIPEPGAPPRLFPDGRFLLVNLRPGGGTRAGADVSSPGGLVALWTRCPHLGCTVPWKDGAAFNDGSGRVGWFVCPCHGSTYTRAGVRVRGPATRSMDTMRVEVVDGGIIVQTGDRRDGDDANTERAVAWLAVAPRASIVPAADTRAY
jgi:cytochrome b6-f complex iron-sulfur subunit